VILGQSGPLLYDGEDTVIDGDAPELDIAA
jgi:hypothetical protein